MNLKWQWLPIILGGSWLGYHWLGQRAVPAEPLRAHRQDVTYSQTPTLMIPGWAGNAWTFNRFLQWLSRTGYAHKVLTVHVSWTGKLRFSGQWDGTGENPVIQVLFDHSATRGYQQQVLWLTAILRALKQRYGVTSYNVVAHSWGGSAAIHTLVRHGHHAELPVLHRLVLLGAPVDEGSLEVPDVSYQRLRAAKHHLMVHPKARIINVYGTLSGHLTDGSVPVSQITPLRAVVSGSPVDYLEIHVPATSHRQLHATERMWHLIATQLWVKA